MLTALASGITFFVAWLFVGIAAGMGWKYSEPLSQAITKGYNASARRITSWRDRSRNWFEKRRDVRIERRDERARERQVTKPNGKDVTAGAHG